MHPYFVLPDELVCGVFHWYSLFHIYTNSEKKKPKTDHSSVWAAGPSLHAWEIQCSFGCPGIQVLRVLPDKRGLSH